MKEKKVRVKKEKRKAISGLYAIINAETGRRYIGQSCDLKTRINRHRSELKSNKHPNKRLQEDYNRLGERFFSYEIIATYEGKNFNELCQVEEHYMKLLPDHLLYNSPGNTFTKWALKKGRDMREL